MKYLKNYAKKISGGWKTDNILKGVYRHALADKSSEMDRISGNHIQSLIL